MWMDTRQLAACFGGIDAPWCDLPRSDSLSPLGERAGVRGLPPRHREIVTPSPHPSPSGRGSRARRVRTWCLHFNEMRALATTVRVLCGLAFGAFVAPPAVGAEIRVFSSGAPSEVEKTLAAAFTQATGHQVIFTVATPADIQARLKGGETPDVVILPAPIIGTLEKSGTLRPGRVDLARVGIGVIVRGGAPLPDSPGVDAGGKMLLGARSIVLSDPAGGGLAGVALARMVAEMGIADAVKPKLTYMFAISGGAKLVANGEVE